MRASIAVALASFVCGCSEAPSSPVTAPARSGQLVVVASNTPLQWLAARIGGTGVSVRILAPEELDPAFWSPTEADVLAMQSADLVILNSAGYEPWLARVSLPESKLVATADRFRDRWIEAGEGPTHSHGLSGEHTHKGIHFTTWIDPELAGLQATAVGDALIKAMPSGEKGFADNLAAVLRDLDELDHRLQAAIDGEQGRPVVVSHPVYDYLIRGYGLNAIAVHWEPDEMPADSEWSALAARLEEHPAKWMIWEGEPDAAIRERLSAMGIESAVFDPGGNLGPGDPSRWLELQRRNAAELARVYQ